MRKLTPCTRPLMMACNWGVDSDHLTKSLRTGAYLTVMLRACR
jgi:hypothetical protein